MKKISKAALRIEGQPMFKLLDKAKRLESQGRDILHFEIGDPDFDTPSNIINAACASLKRGEVHYTSSKGLLEFQQVICDATKHSRGFLPDTDQVLVVPGANMAIFYAVYCLVDPGEEVIVPNPGFPTYYSVLKMCGVNAVEVPLREENAFRMNPEDIEQRITEKTRLIIINSPQNPTGAVMTSGEIEAVYKIAEKHDIYIYSDEIYARMQYEGLLFSSPSIFDKCREYTIVANGFSKAFAMTGWRLGALVGPSEVIDRMEMLLQTTSSCVSPFIQKAGIEAIIGDQSDVLKMVKEYEERRNLLVEGLNSINGISCLKPEGSFYLFANITKTGMSSDEIADYLLEDVGVVVLPGNNFGKFGEGFIRMCYAASKPDISEAITRIKSSIGKLNSK
jgi:aspartate aminotransferase